MNLDKRYSDLIMLHTLKERFDYLKLDSIIGMETFGYDRYLNQVFYRSPEWKRFRNEIIIRDNGCDLACEDYPIFGKILIHHLNPITKEDILYRRDNLFDPENVICVSMRIHNAIHYGDESLLYSDVVERKRNDTILWKKLGG